MKLNRNFKMNGLDAKNKGEILFAMAKILA
jgi:hypothetical protein